MNENEKLHLVSRRRRTAQEHIKCDECRATIDPQAGSPAWPVAWTTRREVWLRSERSCKGRGRR